MEWNSIFFSKKTIARLIGTYIILCVTLLGCHQPRLVGNGLSGQPILIENPEVSQAFYGELVGAPHFYRIQSPRDFVLYVNILVPFIESAPTGFEVDIARDTQKFFTFGGDGMEWKKFFEPFAGDSYLRGPEFEKKVAAGDYFITVRNRDNCGQYVLAVGKIESFPLKEIIKTYRVLPDIKQKFFHKSPVMAFINLFTLLLFVPIFLFFFLIFRLAVRFFKK